MTGEVSPHGETAGVARHLHAPALGCTTSPGTRSVGSPRPPTRWVTPRPAASTVTRYLTSTTDGSGNVTTNTFDAADERTAVVAPNGTVIRTAYNLDGTVAATTDGLGSSTSYGYEPRPG